MASAKTNSNQHFFQAVANGSVDDLREILDKGGRESTTKLAQSYNEMGETPLLVAIVKDHFDVMKFLVDELDVDIGQTGRFIWNLVDCADCPPLFAAAISLRTDFTRTFIWRRQDRGKPLLNLASFLSSSTTCHKKINVLQLMGATCLLKDDPRLRFDGLSYWMEAMALENSNAEIGHSWISNHSSIPAFQFTGSISEMMTLEHLKLMINGELEFDQRLVKERAFRVSQQVLSYMQLYPDMFIISHFLGDMSTDLEGPEYFTTDKRQHLTITAKYTFQLLKLWCEKENQSLFTQMQTWPFMKQAISHSLDLFEGMRLFVPHHVLSFSDLMAMIDFACEHLHRMYTKFWPPEENLRSKEIGHVTRLVRHIALFIFRALPEFSQQEDQQFKQCLYHYVRLYRGSEIDRPNLLHEVCCWSFISKQRKADYDKFVQLFLDVGEDSNATDSHGNTPLHCVLANNECEHCYEQSCFFEEYALIVKSNCMAVIKLLLDSGCHIDQSNERGETILGLLKHHRRMGLFFDEDLDLYLEFVFNAVLPLTCYSAQSVRKYNLSTEQLPLALQLSVRRH